MKTIHFLTFAFAAALTHGCSTDNGKDAASAKGSQPVTIATSASDDMATRDARDFIHHVAMVNLSEIELGTLAADRGATDEVKTFAKMMIDDHTASRDTLKTLGSDLKIELSGQPDGKHTDRRDKLAERQGADFDREYAGAMVEGHKDLIEQLEPRVDKKALDLWKAEMNNKSRVVGAPVPILPDQSENPTTMRINQFAAGMYPIVHAHLERARALESSLKKRQTTP